MANGYSQIRLTEYETGFLPGVNLSSRDHKIADSLSGEDGRLIIEELKHGIRIKATSWVGVVRFKNFEVCVVPKFAGENLGLVSMLAFTTGLDALNRNKGLRDLATLPAEDLFDLLALLFAESCERIVNGGLLYDYIVKEQDLPVLRGRLLLDEQIRRRMGQVDRIECRYDEHSSDVVENQILTYTLSFCARRVRNMGVLRKVRLLMQIFLQSCTIEGAVIDELLANITYNRMNQHYQEPIELARILLLQSGVHDLFSVGTTKSFAFLLDMNKIFELFVLRFIERALANSRWQVKYQYRDRSIIWDAEANRPYSQVIPDLLLENKDDFKNRLVIDTKYKLYDFKKVSPSDIYQCFLYAYAYSPKSTITPKSVILYPTLRKVPVSNTLHVRSKERIVGAKVVAQGFNIPTALEEIRLNIAGKVSQQVIDLVKEKQITEKNRNE